MTTRLDLTLVEGQLATRYVGRSILYLPRAGSTQDVARDQAESDGIEGTVVLAEEQTAGRGRLARTWLSPAGKNLYLTVVMRPPAPRLRSLSVVTPLAVVDALQGAVGLDARIKWPNDVLVGGRKIAGILIETELAGDTVKYALVGVGLNVNMDVAKAVEIADIATSVRRELGREASRERLLAALLNTFESRYEEASLGDAVFRAWRSRLDTLGRPVRATLGERVVDGMAEDVDAEGNLLIRRDDGSLAVVEAGDVTLRG